MLRERALERLQAGPAGVAPVTAATAVVVGAAGIALLELTSAPGRRPPLNEVALWLLLGLAVAGLAGLAAAAALRRRARPAGGPRRDLLTAVLLAAAVVMVALLAPVHYLAARTHPTTLWWNHFGFVDKRWLFAVFLVATAGSALALTVSARVVETAHAGPPSWRAWLGALLPAAGTARARPRGAARTALEILAAVAIATYFFGPPWHLPPRGIDYHETPTMGAVQAIHAGSLPYIDAAAEQYGPLTQLANAAWLGVSGHRSVDGLRETTLMIQWLAAAIFLGVVFVRTRLVVAATTAVAAFTLFPALQMFGISGDGTIWGFWGWTNALRYAGVFLVAMAFAPVAARGRRRRAVALGAAWGLLCLAAQENLAGGVLALVILAVLLVVTGTVGRRAVLATPAWIGAGFALAWAPAVAFYAAHGRLGRFFEFYLLVPRAVTAGYSDTPWHGNAAFRALYVGLPFLLGALLLAALLAARPLRVAQQWSDRRVLLVSALVAAVVCHVGALTQSEPRHLVNTELALPAAACLAVFELPALLGARPGAPRWAGGAAIALAFLALLPQVPRGFEVRLIPAKLYRPLHARLSPPPASPLPPGIRAGSIAAARVGPTTLRQPRCCTRNRVPMRELVAFMDRLHGTVGRRRAFVDSTPVLVAPATYFLADLRPAPFRQDYGTMVINSDVRARWFADFRRRAGGMEALVTVRPRRPAVRIWLRAHPRHRRTVVRAGSLRAIVFTSS